jgi:hypothetical protein
VKALQKNHLATKTQEKNARAQSSNAVLPPKQKNHQATRAQPKKCQSTFFQPSASTKAEKTTNDKEND